jgi:hypothetical protein
MTGIVKPDPAGLKAHKADAIREYIRAGVAEQKAMHDMEGVIKT